jgi:hypothetical protein
MAYRPYALHTAAYRYDPPVKQSMRPQRGSWAFVTVDGRDWGTGRCGDGGPGALAGALSELLGH